MMPPTLNDGSQEWIEYQMWLRLRIVAGSLTPEQETRVNTLYQILIKRSPKPPTLGKGYANEA